MNVALEIGFVGLELLISSGDLFFEGFYPKGEFAQEVKFSSFLFCEGRAFVELRSGEK